MAERELRRMSRTELIEIIYALKQQEDELEQQNAALKQQLADRTLRVEQAGSIAEAALGLNRVFEAAQAAADDYLNAVKAANAGTQAQADRIIAQAQAQAEDIRAEAGKEAEQTLAQAEQKRARVEAECAARLDRTEQEVRARWDAFEHSASEILDRCGSIEVLPPERGAE